MKVAIVGAGVAGLAAAALLSQQGHQVEVFERRTGIGSIGAGVMLWPEACAVLDRLRLLNDALGVAGKPDRLRRLSADGNLITELDFANLTGSSPYAVMSILRSDLMALLTSACRSLVIHYGADINAGSLAQLQQQFELVLGCDGRMNSPSRHVVEPSATPVYSGVVNVIGISRGVPEQLTEVLDYWQPDLRFGVVPVSEHSCYWAAAWSEPNALLSPVSFKQISDRFADWPIHSILQRMEAGSLRTIAVHDLEPLTHWHQGNLLLLGDAAHAPLPTSGRGASMALQDAGILVDKLANSSTLNNVFAEFYRAQFETTKSIQKYGREMANQLFPTRVSFAGGHTS